MIKVLFFAQVRELVGTDALEVAADFPTVEALRQHLAAQSDRWALRWKTASCWPPSIRRWSVLNIR